MSGQVTAPWIAPYLQGITDTHISEQCQSSSTRHLFGKDDQGRVLSSRILFGARVSLQIGLFAISLSLLVGIPVGLIAGLWGGQLTSWCYALQMWFSASHLSFSPWPSRRPLAQVFAMQ